MIKPKLAFVLLTLWPALPCAGQNTGFRQVTHTLPVAIQRGTTRTLKLHSNFTLDKTHSVFFRPAGPAMKFLETKPVAAPRKGQ